ncbi:MAG: hypothetical protein RML40_05900 [Bacteroidota bacterium]|nr:hypothetical protein [Bacteroidota bacterium]
MSIAIVLSFCGTVQAAPCISSTPEDSDNAIRSPLSLIQQPYQTLLTFGGLLGISTQYDAYHSPLLYTGFTSGLEAELRSYSDHIFWNACVIAANSRTTPVPEQPLNPKAAIAIVQSNLSANLGFRVYEQREQPLRAFVGPLLNIMLHTKTNTTFQNNALAIDAHIALGAMTRIEYDFELLGKQWRAYTHLQLPILGVGLRPYYSTNLPSIIANEDGEDIEAILKNFRTVSIINFPNITSRIGLEYMLDTGNWLSIAYQWNYYDYALFNRVVFARHALVFSLLARI